ncbi:cytochrome b [Ramlibacter solisilvae]|uniref:Cytochrome B561 n=1 Tax=Ramlibacter tataouinensis TaxID=94132 RepID=A0A127JZB5_9BURK|nr:cytochrome b/b6 domain-containing protein [Ramlibacter tataouinensis]AMO23462.1 cytochrome B561 [Ramlibacter tataouinensis]
MKAWTNTELSYGSVAVLLHWAMAALLLLLLAMGVYMVGLPEVGFDREKITLILVHKALGLLALVAVLLRMAWRSGNPMPELAAGLPDWQQLSARVVHLLFYALMLALPVTGWLMSSAGGYPVSFFGVFELPDFVAVNQRNFQIWIVVHRWLGYALALLIVAHAGAALHHAWVRRDDTLRRML